MSAKTTTQDIGELTFKIDPQALREIISQGRLSEFAAVAAAQAASQVSAQIVDHVAAAALDPGKLAAAAAVNVKYVLEGGDFQTPVPGRHGPGPRPGVLVLQSFMQRGV